MLKLAADTIVTLMMLTHPAPSNDPLTLREQYVQPDVGLYLPKKGSDLEKRLNDGAENIGIKIPEELRWLIRGYEGLVQDYTNMRFWTDKYLSWKIIDSDNIQIEIGYIRTPELKNMKDADAYQIGARAQFTVF
jgi:hypothetical protein